MTWYTLFNKLRKMTFKDAQSSKVYALLENPATGKTKRLMLTLKYDAKGKPYLIKEQFMMNKNEVRIGDKIWFQESWTDRIIYGIVTKISNNGVRLDGVNRDDNSFIGSSAAIQNIMYKTQDDAIKGVREKDDRRVDAIRAYIKRAKELGVLDQHICR